MADLGFNPENVIPVITPVMKMFVQANTPLTEQDLRTTIGTLDIIEAFDVARGVVIDHITPEEVVTEKGKPVTIGLGKKRRGDKDFKLYWADIFAEATMALEYHFTRRVQLKTGVKESIPPMVLRLVKLIILPVIQEFSQHSPEHILKMLDPKRVGLEGRDIFGYMSRYIACGDAETHPSNVLVAREVLKKRCSTKAPVFDRLAMIRSIAEKVQEKEE